MGSAPGLEVVHPMAVVLLGGLATSTFLSLFVLPALYLRFGRGAGGPAAGDEDDLMRRWVSVDPEPAPAGAGAGADADREATA
jgi:predicted RND superfamily exporter protein